MFYSVEEYARLIVNKFLEKYTPDEIKEMSAVDLEAAFIVTICDLTMDENYFLKDNMVERHCAWKACAPIVGSAFKMALEETDQSSQAV